MALNHTYLGLISRNYSSISNFYIHISKVKCLKRKYFYNMWNIIALVFVLRGYLKQKMICLYHTGILWSSSFLHFQHQNFHIKLSRISPSPKKCYIKYLLFLLPTISRHFLLHPIRTVILYIFYFLFTKTVISKYFLPLSPHQNCHIKYLLPTFR